MQNKTINQLISRYRSVDDAKLYSEYGVDDPQKLLEVAREIMRNIPPSFGACAMLSAMWAGYLKDYHGIPAMVVAGDLKISGKTIFKCKKNLPEPKKSGNIISKSWSGHCWIEIDSWIGDLSLFRIAYQIEGNSVLRDFIVSSFGHNRGALLCQQSDLPTGMKYVPKYVLNDNQIDSLISGVAHSIGIAS
ncbi:MAG: hypothetical protein ACI9LM_001376 [Alteromonadaceae bacterium]|jgi:hypothetical protein